MPVHIRRHVYVDPETRAQDTLRAITTDEQWRTYRIGGYIDVWTQPFLFKRWYRIYNRRLFPVQRLHPKTARLGRKYCVNMWCYGLMPPTDQVIAFKLLIEGAWWKFVKAAVFKLRVSVPKRMY